MKPSRSKAWSGRQWRPAKFRAMLAELGLWRAGAPPEGTSPLLTSSTSSHECRDGDPAPSSPSAASSGQPPLRGKPGRPPRSPSPSLCPAPVRSAAPRVTPHLSRAGEQRGRRVCGLARRERRAGDRPRPPPAPPLPPLTALRAVAPARAGQRSPPASTRRPPRPAPRRRPAPSPPPRPLPDTAAARKRSRCRPEALPPRLSQDGGGHRNRAAVFRYVQAPERGGNAAGALGSPLSPSSSFFLAAAGGLLPAPGPPRAAAAAGHGAPLGRAGLV